MNNFAISSTGIGDALQRSASALYGAGNTLEESIGLITAANAIVQNPESVGTAMKTLTMYLRAAKTELEDAGESSEGCAESVSKLREQLMDLTGVDIMLDKDTFKSTYQIIKEISEVWENLTDTTRANVTSLIAGKRNANVVQALMTNFEDAENAMQTAANATGSAFAENEKYIDSIAGRLDILKGQFEAFSQGVINDGVVKFFVTLATKILELGNALNKVHLLMPLIAASIAGIAGSGLVGDVSKIITSVQTIINLNGNAASVSTTLSGAIAGLSKQQKVLLANQLQTIMASETVDAEYKKQIASVLGLISADTGLAAANQGVAASFAAIWTAIPLAGKIALIAVALTSVIQIISGFTKPAEDMKEEANGIVDSFSNAQKEYSNNSKTLSELSDRYNELSKGVGANGENISLTAAEYEEYQSILQQLIDISPGIVLSYDDQGQAILKYKDALSGAITEQEKYIKNQRDIYIGSGQELFDGLHVQAVELNQKLTQAGNDLSKALGIGHADALKEALDAIGGNSEFGLTAENLKKIYENSDAFLTTLRNSGQYSADSIRDIQMAIKGLSDEYMGLQDVDSKATDWLMEFLKDESWYDNVPTEALDELRSGIDSVTSGLAPFSENMSNATAYGEEFATAIGSEAAQSLRKMAEGLTDGEGDVEAGLKAYNDAVKQFAESFEGSPEVLAQLMAYFFSFTNAAKGGAPAVDGATKSVVGLKDALEQLKTGYELLNKARAEMDKNGGLSGDTVKSIQDALGEGEKLTDYLYTENGAIKLNTEAWEERSKAIMENDILALEERIRTLEDENAELWSSSDNGRVTENTDKIRENTAAIADAKAQLELYKSLLESGTAGDDPFDLQGMFSDMDNVSSKATTLVKALEDLGAGNLQNWTDLITKFPELMSVEDLFDINTLDGQEAAISSVLEKLEADYDGLIQKRIEILQEARGLEAAAGADDATLASYDNLIANLERLKALKLDEILGATTDEDPLKEINDSLNAFSTAVSNARSAQSVLDDIAKGEKTDIELLTDIVDLAKKSGRPLTDFISGFNGNEIEFNDNEITSQIDTFLEEVQKLEKTDPEKYGGLTGYIKQMIGDDDVEAPLDKLKGSLGDVEKVVTLISDTATHGIDLDAIQSLQDLFGEDWEAYIWKDSDGNYASIATEALRNYINAELDAQGVTGGLRAIIDNMFESAINGADDAKSAIEGLADAVSNLQNAMSLRSTILGGHGDPLDVLDKLFEIAKNNENIDITDLIQFGEDGGFDFTKSEAALNEYIDSLLDYETLVKQFPELGEMAGSEEFVNSLRNAVKAEVDASTEAENLSESLGGLSSALSNASSAGQILSDIAKGEKSDFEIFQDVISLAETAGEDISKYITSFDENGIHWNTEALRQARTEFLATIQAFESEHQEFAGLTQYLESMTETEEAAATFSDAMSKVKSSLDLVRDTAKNGISLDTFEKARELFGDDWQTYFNFDETGNAIGINIAKTYEFLNAQIEAGEMTAQEAELIRQSWVNAARGIDETTTSFDALTSAISGLQSVTQLLSNIDSGTGSMTDMLNQVIDIARNSDFNLAELLTFDAGAIDFNRAEIAKYQADLFSYEKLKGVPGMTEEIAAAIQNLVRQEAEATAATESFNTALSNISKARGVIENIRSGDGDIVSMLQSASEMASLSGGNISDFFTTVGGELRWSEEAVARWAETWIQSLEGAEGVTPEIMASLREYVTSITNTQDAYTVASEGINHVLEAIKSSVSELGANNEQMSQLTDRYKDLAGYSPERLFEKTSMGVHLNVVELERLEDAYQKQERAGHEAELQKLQQEYQSLTDKINHTSDATAREQLFADRQEVADKISALNTLASQYDALTSKYNMWKQAQSMGEEGDMYDDIAGSLENIKKLYDDGLIGTNKFRKAVQLMTNEDLTGKSAQELKQIYEDRFPNLQKYFKEGKEAGKGIDTLFSDIEKAGERVGKTWAWKDEEGGWQFQADNLDEVAEEIGISGELLEMALRKVPDIGGKIDLTGYGEGIEKFAGDAESAIEEIQQSKEKLDESFKNGEIDTQEYVDAWDALDRYQKKLEEIQGSSGGEVEKPISIDEAMAQIEQLKTAVETMADIGIEIPVTITGDIETLEKIIAGGLLPETAPENEVQIPAEIIPKLEEFDTFDPMDIPTRLIPPEETEMPEVEVLVKPKIQEGEDGAPSFNDEEVTVKFNADTSEPDDYTPEDKEAQVVYSVDDDAVSSYTPPDKSAEVNYTPDFSSVLSATVPVLKGKVKYTADTSGVGVATGTAKAGGTAYKNGNGALSGNVFALSGELGPELVVRDGRYFTVGNDGAELFPFKSGDIIFNASQTKELLKTGRVKSNGGRGRLIGDGSAYVEGTAFTGGSASWKYEGSSGSGSGGGKKSGNGNNGGNNKKDSKDDKDWFDWIDIAISRIERQIENFGRVAESTFKTFATRLKAIGSVTSKEIKKVNDEIDLQRKAADRYLEQAKTVAKETGLSSKLQKLVRSGKIDITKYKGETLDAIKQYQEWYEKYLESLDSIKELQSDLADLYKERFELVEKSYEKKIAQTEHKLTMYDKQVSRSEYSGEDKPFQSMIKAREKGIKQLNAEAEALQKKLDEAVASGAIKKGSEDWHDMVEAIQKVEEEAADAALEISKIYKERFDDVQQQFENKLGLITRMLDTFDKRAEASYFTGEAKPFNDTIALQRQNLKQLNKEATSLEKQLEAAMKDPVNGIKEGSQAWYDMTAAIAETKSAAVDAAIAIAQTYKDAFDDVGNRYDLLIGKIDSDSQALQRKLDMLEAHGYMGGAEIYRDLQEQERLNIELRTKEREELQAQLGAATSAADGIRIGSEAWFEMQQRIDDTTAAIEESQIALVKYEKQIRQLDWDAFDFVQDRISAITDESDFLIKLMESSKLFDELGKFTDTGTATVGLHAQNFDVYMHQADAYFKELQDIEKQLADDPADTKLIERREQLLKLQRDSILAANDEKEAIKDLVEEGIKTELNHLKELIDKYNELMDAQKSQYDYQKSIAKQTKEIVSLQKQLNAYQGDTSEENRVRIQKLVVSLEDARENLRESQYDQYISDQKKLLDDLYSEYETVLNKRLDDADALFRIMVDQTNENSQKIYETLGDQCSNVGTQLSIVMDNIWGTGGGTSVVSTYTSQITTAIGAVANAINGEGGAVTMISSVLMSEEEALHTAIEAAQKAVTDGVSGSKTDLSTLEGSAGSIATTTSTISTTLTNLESYVKAIKETVAKSQEEPQTEPDKQNSKYKAGDYVKVSGKVGLRGDDLKFRRYTKESEGMKVLGEKTENGQKYYQVEYLSNNGEITTGWVIASKLEGASEKTQAGAYKAKVKAKKANLYMGNTNGGTFVADTATVAKGETFDYLRTVKDSNGTTYAEITYKNKRRYLKLSDIDVSGFAGGGYIADLQKLAYRNGDDMVTVNTLKRGEAVLTTAEAAQFQKLVASLPSLHGAVDIASRLKELSATPSNINGGGISIGDISLNMPIDHVEDYDDLVRHMRDDKTFERMVKTIVLNPLSGKSSMAKKGYYN